PATFQAFDQVGIGRHGASSSLRLKTPALLCVAWPGRRASVQDNPRLLDRNPGTLCTLSTPSLEFHAQPVVSKTDVRRKHGLGGAVIQLVGKMSEQRAARFQPGDHGERLLQRKMRGM